MARAKSADARLQALEQRTRRLRASRRILMTLLEEEHRLRTQEVSALRAQNRRLRRKIRQAGHSRQEKGNRARKEKSSP